MNTREIAVTRIVKSRACALLLMIVAFTAATAVAVMNPGSETSLGISRGLFSFNGLSDSATVAICIGLNLLTVILMTLLNGTFNLLRTTSWLFLAMYMAMQTATPIIMTRSVSGNILVVGILVAIWILYSLYQNPQQTRRVFLAFFIITVLSCLHYAYLLFIPAFIAGLAQMRALSFRSLLAAGVGIICPLWLLLAFGWIDFSHGLPALGWDIPGIDFIIQHPVLSVAAAFTILSGLVILMANMLKVYGYNARIRAHNGLMLLVWLCSAALCIADFNSIWCVLPLLNCTTAFQTGLMFRIYTMKRAYVPVLTMITVYATLYICNTVLYI